MNYQKYTTCEYQSIALRIFEELSKENSIYRSARITSFVKKNNRLIKAISNVFNLFFMYILYFYKKKCQKLNAKICKSSALCKNLIQIIEC